MVPWEDAVIKSTVGVEEPTMAHAIVIDDDPISCLLITELLTSTQHAVMSTTDLQEGEHHHHDTATLSVMLLNLTMPTPSGVDILERLRATPEARARHEISCARRLYVWSQLLACRRYQARVRRAR
jgi:CheY-like chemotaxis protein